MAQEGLLRVGQSGLMVRCVIATLALALTGEVSERGDFDGDRAFRTLVDLTRLGPRPAGSQANRDAQQQIAWRFRQAGWTTEIQSFTTSVDGQASTLGNVIARRKGKSSNLILLLTHHDTTRRGSELSVGANDGASGPALLTELAVRLGSLASFSEIWLVSCDASHMSGDEPGNRALLGSRELIRLLSTEERLASIQAVISIDRIADRDLHLTPDARVDEELQKSMLNIADRLGIPLLADPRPRIVHEMDKFKRQSDPRFRIEAEHVPFWEVGVEPLLAVIDAERSGTVEPAASSGVDDLRTVSALSLDRTGQLVLELVLYLDKVR